MIDFSYNLKALLRLEKINAKEFSNLTGVGYSTLGRYLSGERTPSVEIINKILAVPRFAQYRNLLTSNNEPISESSDPREAEILSMLHRLRDLDELDDAVDHLEVLIERAEKRKTRAEDQ